MSYTSTPSTVKDLLYAHSQRLLELRGQLETAVTGDPSFKMQIIHSIDIWCHDFESLKDPSNLRTDAFVNMETRYLNIEQFAENQLGQNAIVNTDAPLVAQ